MQKGRGLTAGLTRLLTGRTRGVRGLARCTTHVRWTGDVGADAAPWAESTACGGPVMIQPVSSNPDRPEGSDDASMMGRPPATAQWL